MHFLDFIHFITRPRGLLKKWLNRPTQQMQSPPASNDVRGAACLCILSVTCDAPDVVRLEQEIGALAQQQQLIVCHLHRRPLPDRARLQLMATLRCAADTHSHLIKMVHTLAIDRAVHAVRWEKLPRALPRQAQNHIEIRTHRAHLKRPSAFQAAAQAPPAANRQP
ncbi:MAG: hypothetical protein JWP38_2425 [Herbaspirillum sp.]|nr:hypothetical protein [Herbaspirillum sp.]